jgi:hypothetical protein
MTELMRLRGMALARPEFIKQLSCMRHLTELAALRVACKEA